MRHRLVTYLLLLSLLCLAQVQTKENCIRVSTFLNAAGTDSITDITYYNELGRETVQVAVRRAPTGKEIGFESSTEDITLPNNYEGGNDQFAYAASGNDFATYNKNLWGYRFCDRRMDRVYGLDLYDSQARFYDPEIGRFDTQDGKSENDYAVSPYLYCLANPVNTLDDDGNSAWSKFAKIGFRVGKTVAKQGFSALTKTATYAEAVSDSTKETLKAQAKGPKIPSKTLWNSKEKNNAHIDLENNAQSKRVGQIHYQDKNGKFYYDEKTKKFINAPRYVNKLLKNNIEVQKAIQKGLKYLYGK